MATGVITAAVERMHPVPRLPLDLACWMLTEGVRQRSSGVPIPALFTVVIASSEAM